MTARPALIATALALLALLPGLAAAQTEALAPEADPIGDYATDSDAWNGLGYLLETAREAKVDVELTAELDLSRLRPSYTLLWLYPTQDLPVDALLDYVEDGGHLIVADDHGRADALFARLGIERRPHGPTVHSRWYQGQEGLPIAVPDHKHFLFFNVEEVVSNHPAVLSGAGERVLGFDVASERLVVEVQHGRGAVLAIADPSLFTNEMLRRFYGNKQFAANVMRLYCEQDPCRLRLLGPTTTAQGTYRRGAGPMGGLARTLDEGLETLDETIGALSRKLAERPWAFGVAGVVLLVALALGLVMLARGRRPHRMPHLSAPAAGGPPPTEEAVGYAANRAEADFVVLAQTLLERVEHLRARGLLRSLTDEAAGAAGPSDERELARGALLRIDREAASLLAPEPPVVTADRFERLYDNVRLVTRWADQRGRGRSSGPRKERHVSA